MPSPLARSPYAVLGVSEQASHAELRRAYRRRLRETHPDTGGKAVDFDRVQRAWEQVGTPEARSAYDSGAARDSDTPSRTWAPAAPAKRASASRPQARTHGHPGGWYREQYLALLQEWVGRGAAIPNPYDPTLVRSAPGEIRHLLACAIAEEETAVVLAGLGIGFTVWHDVLSDPARGGAGKIDHIVLGPTGLWAMLSEDWGDHVATRRGDLIGPGIRPDERPMHDLAGRARRFERQAKVRFTALAIVIPDDTSAEGVVALGTVRGARAFLVQRARLADLVQTRAAGVAFGGTDHFEVRTRVQGAAQYV
ncbi:nuclease-related domain-containing protein [Pseudolysinimonas yzui]|uniref:nuclease-related domain-containing protein n=1 Tax=Pseudolysinimonas yzui TaxID=2708254 RepID=UPI001E49641F|nr:nuclease-related domain-containing protein [Pseudolysinimonas yzui]